MYNQKYKFADILITFVAINCSCLIRDTMILLNIHISILFLSMIRTINVYSYIYNYPIYVEDQQQRSSNISLSPFRSNNNPKNFLFYLFPKFFCTNKLFAQASNWLSCKFVMLSNEVSYRTCTYPLIPNAFSVVLFVNNPKLNDYQYSSPRLFWFKFHKSMLFLMFIAYQRIVWS